MVSTPGEETRGGCKGERTTHETSGKTWDAWATQRRRRMGGAGAAVGVQATRGTRGPPRAPMRRGGTRAHTQEEGLGCDDGQHGPHASQGRWAGAVEETTHWGHLIKRCAKETVATPAGGATGAARLSRGGSHVSGGRRKARALVRHPLGLAGGRQAPRMGLEMSTTGRNLARPLRRGRNAQAANQSPAWGEVFLWELLFYC